MALVLAGGLTLAAAPNPSTEFRATKLAALDLAVSNAIAAKRLPGAVLWLERNGAAYHRAYGRRAVVPSAEPMTEDTVFDAASLTKVLATAPAVMKLVEQGLVSLDAPLGQYLSECQSQPIGAITIRQLLTHVSGLPPGLPRAEPWLGNSNALAIAISEPLGEPPGTRFRYSDVNFILLGFLVERVSGQPLDQFVQKEIFQPLGMTRTGFRRFEPTAPDGFPQTDPAGDLGLVAPTEVLSTNRVLRGVVHDPTARRLGGVAGHAGVFTTAEDLARFCRMFLPGTTPAAAAPLKPSTLALMTAVQSPPGLTRRGLGWDIDSPYSGIRGSVFPIGGFGHTGWTGPSIWIDPFSGTFLVFMSNRNHPTEDGNVVPLRRELATLAAEAVQHFNFAGVPGALAPEPPKAPVTPAPKAAAPGAPVLNGIDVLVRDGFQPLRGLKVGLVTNQTGRDRRRRLSLDLLKEAPEVHLVALFSPEHGVRGLLDQEKIGDTVDAQTGLPIHSLYGERRAPTPEQLAPLDALVFDIQDIGTRFYTYISTLGNCLEAAARAGKRVVVLDRVNPITSRVEGPVSSGERSFVAWHEIPLRHGLTVGELARLFNAERELGADLMVIPVEGWKPDQWFDDTGLPWVNPSPNMRSLTQATLYPGVALLEFCALSVGRGTDTPFELLGAPYIDDLQLAAELNRASLPGVRFVSLRFTPKSSTFAGKECGGVQILLTDRKAFRAADLGIVLATTLHRLHPGDLQVERMGRLLMSPPVLQAVQAGRSLGEIRALWTQDLARFEERRKPFLLYPR